MFGLEYSEFKNNFKDIKSNLNTGHTIYRFEGTETQIKSL